MCFLSVFGCVNLEVGVHGDGKVAQSETHGEVYYCLEKMQRIQTNDSMKSNNAMRPEDLMVGDWFRFRYTIDGKEIVKTFRISRIVDDIGHVWGDGFGCMCKPERLEPVPLTPEILEKNGFTELRNDFTFLEFSDDNVYMSYSYRDKIGTCYLIVRRFVPFRDVEIEGKVIYAHELQHALKDCKIAKEIVL